MESAIHVYEIHPRKDKRGVANIRASEACDITERPLSGE